MATLNGVEFQILIIEWATYQNNVIQEVIGGDTVVVHSQGYKTDPVKIQGRVRNEKELDAFQEEFYSGGALTFIKDMNSGRQYQIYALGNIKQEDSSNDKFQTGIVFNCLVQLKYPYMESSEITTRSKTITTQNQEWSADDDSNDIKTEGNVDAVPDIQIIGGNTHAGITQIETNSNYNMSASGVGVTITQAAVTGYTANPQTAGQTVNCRKAGMAIIDSFQIEVASYAAGNITCTVYDSVGGTVLGSKTLTINSNGLKTFTFPTPIAVVQNESTCLDSTDSKKIYFRLTATASMQLSLNNSNPYSDGSMYQSDGIINNYDLKFEVVGHSSKEIQQTFTVDETYTLSHVVLNLCKYNYGGSNPITITIKQGGTTLGSSTVVLSGSTFTDINFYLDEQTAHSLELSSGTTYTLVVTPPSDTGNATTVLIKTKTSDVYTNGILTLVEDGDTTRAQTHDLYFKLYFSHSNEDIRIYNTIDTTIKCNIANQILEGAIHQINIDGTGTIDFDDDITTQKYASTNEGMKNIIYDDSNNEFDMADDGYIYWKKDTKFPINGIPTLTSRINITSGIPTIQISTDASTWYNIDTAIVDDVEIVYPLDSDGNLSLVGKTIFYFRIDCVKAAAATCSIKYFKLDINIHTIYAKNPKITKGSSASTFRIDQDSASGMACIIDLIYRDKWWV